MHSFKIINVQEVQVMGMSKLSQIRRNSPSRFPGSRIQHRHRPLLPQTWPTYMVFQWACTKSPPTLDIQVHQVKRAGIPLVDKNHYRRLIMTQKRFFYPPIGYRLQKALPYKYGAENGFHYTFCMFIMLND